VYRDGKPMTLTVKVAELNTEPEDELASNDRGRERPTVEEPTETGFGMSVSALTPRQSRALPSGKGGAVIMELDPSGAAARAGLAPGDVIVRVAGKEMSSVEDVTKALAAVTAGQSVRINYIRTAGGSGAEQFALLRKK
jgi:serine protease Do